MKVFLLAVVQMSVARLSSTWMARRAMSPVISTSTVFAFAVCLAKFPMTLACTPEAMRNVDTGSKENLPVPTVSKS